jgi:crossover junction endodeoxyribonuclease RuvC
LRVLGVDPGTRITGWGIIDVSGSRLTRVASGVLRLGSGELSGRLAVIHAAISSIISEHEPTAASLERNFVARNVQSALRLGEARGAIMAAVAGKAVALTEYTPATVKKAVVGHGRAGKSDVQETMVRLLRLTELPSEDEADALAVAACYALRSGYDGKVSEALGGRAGAKTPRPVHRSRALSEVAKGVLAKQAKRVRRGGVDT